jgi:hypothetical protein
LVPVASVRLTRLFGLGALRFPLHLAAGKLAPDCGFSNSHLCRNTPRNFRRLVGSSCWLRTGRPASVRRESTCPRAIFPAVNGPRFLHPMEEKKGNYTVFGNLALKRFS